MTLTEARRPPKAGRNLPAAIGVGVALGAAVVASLLVVQEVFLGLVSVACVLAVIELTRSLRAGHVAIPGIPVALAAATFPTIAYQWGGGGLGAAFTVAAALVLLWRGALGLRRAAQDAAGGVLALAYVPLLASFTALMLTEPRGQWRVLTFVFLAVASDTGGYVAGVFFGKHPMAPGASPKKSWEGFAGSTVTCLLTGVACAVWMLAAPWWAGLVLGALAAPLATLGDLVESVLKRDLGIKDMGHLLPGHGGVMDRLDSLLVVAAPLWLAMHLLVP